MNKITFIITCFCFTASVCSAQLGSAYRKIIENNTRDDIKYSEGYGTGIPPDSYNFESKSNLELLFFGDINARLEYFVDPSFEGNSGLRLIRDSTDTSFLLEVKRIVNMEEVQKQINEEFPSKGFSTQRELDSILAQEARMTEEDKERRALENGIRNQKIRKERYKRYQIQIRSAPVSDAFADALYAKFISTIDNFTMKGRPPYAGDGDSMTFRVVVDDDVWTLTIHNPRAENIRKLIDLCNRMIADVEAGTFDETEYIKLLDN